MLRKLIFSIGIFAVVFYFSLHAMNDWKEKKYTLSLLAQLKDTSIYQFSNNLEKYFEIYAVAHNNKNEIGFVQEISYASNEFYSAKVFFESTKTFVIINLNDKKMQSYEKYKKEDLKNLLEEKSFDYIPETQKMRNYVSCLYKGNNIEKPIQLLAYSPFNESAKKFNMYAQNQNGDLIVGTAQIPLYYFFTTEKFYLWSATLDKDENKYELMPITALPELDIYTYYTLISRIIFTENDKTIIVFLSDGTVLKITL